MGATTETCKDSYPFKRDYLASLRLNFNHFWMKSLAGYLLHPFIRTNTPGLRIIDIGTGTGIWVSEVAARLPNAIVEGVDISDEQFPHPEFRGDNTRRWTHDAFTAFPEEYSGKFDVVHVRFFVCVASDNTVEKLLENLLALLKPGGYIQWFDPVPQSGRVVSRNGGRPTPACDRLVTQWAKPIPTTANSWIANLPNLFTAHYLNVLAQDKHSNPDYYLPIAAQSAFMGIMEFAPFQDLESNSAKWVEALGQEHKEGAFWDLTWACVLGQKSA